MKKSIQLPVRKNSIGKRLKSYSLLAGSMVVSSMAASGQVIYTDVNPDVELGGIIPDSFPYDSAYALDLNNDGIFDFRLSVNIEGTLSGTAYSFTERIQWDNNATNLVIPQTVGYAPFMKDLPCDDSIPFPYYQYGFNFGFFAIQNSNSSVYYWDNVHDGYIGLKFKAGSDFHWGWARLDVNTDGTVPNIIIKDYAYETTPNKKIEVCDTGVAVGIPAVENKHGLAIFPNPSKGIGTIKLELPITGDLELVVKDALGKEVYRSNFQMKARQKEIPLDLSHLTPGIYFIQLNSATVSLSQKWIKS